MRYKKGKRGSIINKYGVKITKKEQEEIRNLVKELNKVRKKINKEDLIYQAKLDTVEEYSSTQLDEIMKQNSFIISIERCDDN